MARSTNLGFPRIGKNREFKQTIEAYWKGTLNEATFVQTLEGIHFENLKTQVDAGLDIIPLGDFSAYDLMLETAIMLGVVPKRFQGLSGWKLYYAMARGTQETTPCEMKKWFDSNYHYIVPEIEEGFGLTNNRLTTLCQWATTKFPKTSFKPMLIGPFTFLKLAKIKNGKTFAENLTQLTAIYQKIVAEVATTGCEWLQIDEPALCGDVTQDDFKIFQTAYSTLLTQKGNLKITLQTYFGDVAEFYPELWKLSIDGLGLDFIRGAKNKDAVLKHGVPQGKWIGLGVIDGRNIWRTNLRETLDNIQALKVDLSKAWIQPSCSLLHLPVSLDAESKIPSVLKKRLAFATERLGELHLLTRAVNEGAQTVDAQLKAGDAIWKDQEFNSFALNLDVQRRVENLKPEQFRRPLSFEKRLAVQQQALNLPPLPTTTIGSFPQTTEIRQARAKWKKGEITQTQYDQFIKEEMQRVVAVQEEIGLDVLVHGEPERTDMVEYFAEHMKGFQFTQKGWVQSYGTRCIRPPVVYGDVSREQPMTVKEAKIAQSFTKKPMKGMLTGPVTILNWSFPRSDVSKKTTAFQIALALRDEVLDLETNGIHVIQIDEPALREGLPLKQTEWKTYLDWAVNAFKLSSSGVKDTTQIHSHMCYSQFADILESIQGLDADVLSIEDSRSQGHLAKQLSEMHYRNGIGPGIYDVHSERVPPQAEFEKQIQFLVKHTP